MLIVLLGALLVIAGVVWMAGESIWRGRMSGQGARNTTAAAGTLEPEHRGTRFLGLEPNWPGLAMAGIGLALLLIGGIV